VTDERPVLGRAGEKCAARFLRRQGFRIVTRNYSCYAGEIDIVALDGKTVVFVEVKTRTGADHADPEDAVNQPKQKRIGRVAAAFLRQTRSKGRDCRFDIVTVVVDESGEMTVEHIPDAFVPEIDLP
jgi:putative endonuclease